MLNLAYVWCLQLGLTAQLRTPHLSVLSLKIGSSNLTITGIELVLAFFVTAHTVQQTALKLKLHFAVVRSF